MRRFTTYMTAFVAALALALTATAQVRGTGRLGGQVIDKATGKPIANATVTVALPNGSTQPIIATTDKNGRWSALGLVNGLWNIDIAAAGYQTSRGTANVSEIERLPPIKTALAAEEKQEAAAPVATASPLIPKEGVDAIDEAQNLLKLKAGDPNPAGGTVTAADVKANSVKAAADLEKALPMIPADNDKVKTTRIQVQEVMAQAYYKAGDLPHAISTLEKLNASDPWTTPDANQSQRQILLANLYLENGQLDQAKGLLDKMPPSTITDPTVYTNVGILFLNKKNPHDAITYFTKAVDLDPKREDAYYYRGLAHAQLKQTADARADFQQVISLAPDSGDAKDAKQMLDALPKK
ncbi:MAG TPA: tetratricopeptide repeat protein [Thermoanaerobaculia bacterium]|nr:tetratricopeptide repeat protein [Thermoanaerobaculia bacterium]